MKSDNLSTVKGKMKCLAMSSYELTYRLSFCSTRETLDVLSHHRLRKRGRIVKKQNDYQNNKVGRSDRSFILFSCLWFNQPENIDIRSGYILYVRVWVKVCFLDLHQNEIFVKSLRAASYQFINHTKYHSYCMSYC